MPAEARASLILEIVRQSEYLAGVEASTQATADLVAEQERYATLAPKAAAGRKAESDAAKTQAKALKEVEKAYLSALAPHEKTALKLEQVLELRFDDVEATSKQAVAAAHLSAKLEDQTRRFEANRGSQNKLSRSLAELLDEQTKNQTAAIAAGAALIKEGASADKLSAAVLYLRKQEGDHRAELKRLETQLEQVTAAEKAQAKAQEEAAAHYKTSADKLDAVKNALEGLHLPGAQTVDSIKKLSESLKKMNEEGNAAEAAMLKSAIAVGAVTAAAAAAALGVAALVTGVVAITAKSDEWNAELVDLGLNLDEVGTKRVNRAAASIDAIGVVTKGAAVALAEKFSPAVEKVATGIVALGLASIDAIKAMEANLDTWKKYAVVLAIVGPGPLKSAAKAFLKVTEGAAGLEDRLKSLGDGTTDYLAKARELIGTQVEVNAAARDHAPATQEATKAQEDLAPAVELTATMYGRLVQELDHLQKMGAIKTISDIADQQERAAEATVNWGQAASYGASTFQTAMRTASTAIVTFGRDTEKAAKAAFVAQQAAALAQVGVDTAAAIVKGIAIFGPPPSPAGIAAIATASIIGAASAASIVGQTIGAFSAPSVPTSASATAGPSGYTQSPTRTQTGPEGIDEGRGPPPVRHDPRSLPVTDAFYQAVAGARQLVLAPGDEAEVRRAGTLGRSAGDNGGSAAMETLTRAVLQLDATFERTMTAIMVQAHRASVAGPVGAR